uniref:Squamosa-binding protein-like 2 n=1 Tax=Paeonia suffruticosa TaxID=45171 RepID=A0A7G5CEI9_PAESU|nr:squamosa-binding protein-like 2 [Paeonia suffruticosa]
MSSLSVMEWNAKSPLQWDWEHLVMFNAKTAQFPKKLQPTDWRIEGEVGADAAPLYPSGSGCGFGSDLGHGSLSKSSKSASSNSALVGKASKFTIEKGFPGEFNNKKELSKDKATGTSLTLDASVKSGEPLIGLKLGKRTYFEDFSLGSNAKSSSISVIPMSSSSTTKKSRSCAHATRCQVEGCNLDLSSAKEYHQKHRICNIHSKCPKVIVGGLERRFCQQCSRFHSVSEFDEKKRSCRKRLSDHNARRRKPRFEEFQFNSARLSSSLNDADEMKHIGFVLNRVPLVHTRPPASSAGESTCNSKFTQTKWYPLRLAKPVGNNGQLHFPSNDPAYTITTLHNGSNGLMPSKDATDDVLNQGLEESIVSSRSVSSNLDATQDLHHAPSLLSTNSWGSCPPEPLSLDNPLQVNDTTMSFSVPQYSSIAVSEYWQTEQQSTDFRAHTLTPSSNGSNHFQELQMFYNKWN